ncbi:glycosyltransferase [Litoribacter populi]|uniref:glycosyltransferase n=1 Tax=Litoribacter populi TaxID=2598460 RepID=UPI001F1E852C|nr:glycosyltransferase [Litoribacter populi]
MLFICLAFRFKNHVKSYKKVWPSISILVPARNEEANIQDCLAAVARLEYPHDKIQVILGNDGSTDNTGNIMQGWTESQRNWELLNILPSPDNFNMNGKANALAQMAKLAEGDFLLFTDADCRVGSQWAKEMVSAVLDANASLVTGITTLEEVSLFGKLQSLDWWLTLGMVKVMVDFNNNVTSMGNNMLVSRKAYESVGGFESLPFSVTEDFELAKAFSSFGYKSIHQVSEQSLVLTNAIPSYKDLLQQRKRWMRGAMGLGIFWKALLAIQVLFFPSIIFLILQSTLIGGVVWGLKIFIQGVFLRYFALKTNTRLAASSLLLFEFYYLIISWSTIVYYFWPAKITWKGRTYPFNNPK